LASFILILVALAFITIIQLQTASCRLYHITIIIISIII
jgi:hypothetical protein